MPKPIKCSMQVVGSKPAQPSQTPLCEMCRRQKEHYSCDICKITLSTKNSIEKHLLEKCNGWNTQTFHKRIIWKLKPSTDSKYICPNCNKSFHLQSSLINHMLVHDSDKPFKCDECGKEFKRKGTLETHNRIHTGVKPYECGTCSKSFRQQTARNNHELRHKEVKPHICQFCLRPLRQISNLKQHIEKCHPTENLALRGGFVQSQSPKTEKSLKLTFVTSGKRIVKLSLNGVDHQIAD